MRWSDCVLQQVEGEELDRTQATFHRKPQPYGSMGRASDLHSGGRGFRIQLVNRFFFYLKINTFCIHAFKNSVLMTLLLGIPNTHRNGTWAKLNVRHLGTRLWLLLIYSCFCSFFTACWRHWCRGKTGNSCYLLWYINPRRQTVVNQLSCGFNPCLNPTFFQFLDLLEHIFFSDHNCFSF